MKTVTFTVETYIAVCLDDEDLKNYGEDFRYSSLDEMSDDEIIELAELKYDEYGANEEQESYLLNPKIIK